MCLYHLGCTKHEVCVMSGTLTQKKRDMVYIILSKLDTDIPGNILGFYGEAGCDASSSFSCISKLKTRWKQ